MPNIPCSHKTSIFDNSSKNEIQKIFFFSNSTLDELFNDTTHISPDEYIDRPKLTEQKSPFVCIVPPPISRVVTKTKKNNQADDG